MDVEEAKTAILKRLCRDYQRFGRSFGLAAAQIQHELKIPSGVFGDALNDLIGVSVERVPTESTHVRLTEAGTLLCRELRLPETC